MTTKYFYFTGSSKWAKLSKPDSYNGDEKYKINLYMTDKDLETLADSGSKLTVKEDEDGKYVTFSRKTHQQMADGVKVLGRPRVIDADNKPFEQYIGNGSIVTCKVSVYDTKIGKGTRLEAVRVEEWVEYVKEEVISATLDTPVSDSYLLPDKPQDVHLQI